MNSKQVEELVEKNLEKSAGAPVRVVETQYEPTWPKW